MSLQTASIRAALLSAGTELELPVGLIDCTDPPLAGGAGYPCGGAITGVVKVGMRRASPGRVVDIRITTFDAGATYTAIIGGTSVAYSGSPATVTEAATAWAAAISANGTVGASGSSVQTVAAAVDSGSGVVDTVRITGQTAASWTFTATDSGSAALTVTLDPEACTVTVYEERSGIASLTTRISDAGALASLRSWGIMQGASGDAVLEIAEGQNRAVSIQVNGATQIRPHITDILRVTGDGTGVVGSVTYVLRDPVAVVVYGIVS